jgi:hypothetical protein
MAKNPGSEGRKTDRVEPTSAKTGRAPPEEVRTRRVERIRLAGPLHGESGPGDPPFDDYRALQLTVTGTVSLW